MAAERERMVVEQIASRGVRNEAVLSALREVPRHLFVPEALRHEAYADHPLQIGHGQTISQPFIVALMTALARPAATHRALEIGTGSGYQSAVLSRLVAEVFTVEVIDALHREAADRLEGLGYANVTAIRADGYEGWAAGAPYRDRARDRGGGRRARAPRGAVVTGRPPRGACRRPHPGVASHREGRRGTDVHQAGGAGGVRPAGEGEAAPGFRPVYRVSSCRAIWYSPIFIQFWAWYFANSSTFTSLNLLCVNMSARGASLV